MVRLLIDHGADISAREGSRDPPTRQEGAKNAIYYQATEKTALHVAAEAGHYAAVSVLPDLGARTDLKESKGDTAMHLAAANEHSSIIWLLMEHGADDVIVSGLGKSVMQAPAEKGVHRSCFKSIGARTAVPVLIRLEFFLPRIHRPAFVFFSTICHLQIARRESVAGAA